MSNYESHLRIFLDGRMQPWHPENRRFIAGELGKLQVSEPDKYVALKNFYDAKMAQYVKEHPEEFPVMVPYTPKTEAVFTQPAVVTTGPVDPSATVDPTGAPVVGEKKKRGRRPRIPPIEAVTIADPSVVSPTSAPSL